jgi:hypothetical protein
MTSAAKFFLSILLFVLAFFNLANGIRSQAVKEEKTASGCAMNLINHPNNSRIHLVSV